MIAEVAATAEQYYAKHADELLDRYERVTFEEVHASLIPYLPKVPGAALDVGAGSGRDAAWLASHGWAVVAVEPSKALREHGKRLHPDGRIEWLDDALPDLRRTLKLNRLFDTILLSAVWMHVAPAAQMHTLAALRQLSAPNAILTISMRAGGDESDRGFYNTDVPELKELAKRTGFSVVAENTSRDRFNRSDISWTTIVMRR